MNTWFDASDFLNRRVFCENHSYRWDISILGFYVLMEIGQYNALRETFVQYVFNDWKRRKVRAEWLIMLYTACSMTENVLRAKWLEMYNTWWVADVQSVLCEGKCCTAPAEWVKMCNACWMAGNVQCVLSNWKSRMVRVQWLEIYRSCWGAGNTQRVFSNCKHFTIRAEWLEMLYFVR